MDADDATDVAHERFVARVLGEHPWVARLAAPQKKLITSAVKR